MGNGTNEGLAVAALPAPGAGTEGGGRQDGVDEGAGNAVVSYERQQDPETLSGLMVERMFEVLQGSDNPSDEEILGALRDDSSGLGYATQVIEGASGAAADLRRIARDVVGLKMALAIGTSVDGLKLAVRSRLLNLLKANEGELRGSNRMHQALAGSRLARETFGDEIASRVFGLAEVAQITNAASAILKLRIKRIAEAFARSGMPEDLKRRYTYLQDVTLTTGDGRNLTLQVRVMEARGRNDGRGGQLAGGALTEGIINAAKPKAQAVADDVLRMLHDNQFVELKFSWEDIRYARNASSGVEDTSGEASLVAFHTAIS